MRKIILICSSIVTFCLIVTNVYINIKPEKAIDNSDQYSWIEKNINQKTEDMFLYIYSDACLACKEFKPILSGFIEKNKINVVNIDIQDKKYRDLLKKYNVDKTPTLVIIKPSKLIILEGTQTTEELQNYVVS